jgi:hypothetical protein
MSITLRPQWDQQFSYDESIKILTDFAWSHIKESGPFEATLGSILKKRQWSDLCAFELPYSFDDSPSDLINARQALAFFTKLEKLDIGVDKEEVAWERFQEAESMCSVTNGFFRALHRGDAYLHPSVHSILHGAQRKIVRILGEVPSLQRLRFAFGPGSNTSVKASASSPRWKLGARLECSAELLPSAYALLSEAPAWAENHAHAETSCSWLVDVTSVPGKLQFVPKNAKTFRSIVIEPVLNTFAQKGIGSYLKERLALAGVDTTDQTRNQKLARQGSVSGSLATIDLSMASDTISKEVVASLLPLDWFTFLSQFRTGSVEYRGDLLRLEKFSSMGNAFTFELETLLFYALAWSTCDFYGLPTGWVSAYGDDLIIPTEAYSSLSWVLNCCGFKVNSEKSFAAGPFRESCGADYWRGIDIRPYYQKDLVSGQTLFSLHNHYMRQFDFRRAKMVLKRIHPSLHLYGPDGYGDGHLLGDWSHYKASKRNLALGWEGVRFDTFTFKSKRNLRMTEGDYVLPAYSSYVGLPFKSFTDIKDPSDPYVVRGTKGYKRVSIYTLATRIFS